MTNPELIARRRVVTLNALGLHSRAAGEFVEVAERHRSDVHVARDGRVVNGKGVLGLTTHATGCGARPGSEAREGDAKAAPVAPGEPTSALPREAPPPQNS